MQQLLQYIDKEPNWIIVILFGAILGSIFKPLIQLIIYLFTRVKKSDIEYKWFGYYWILKNNGSDSFHAAIAPRFIIC